MGAKAPDAAPEAMTPQKPATLDAAASPTEPSVVPVSEAGPAPTLQAARAPKRLSRLLSLILGRAPARPAAAAEETASMRERRERSQNLLDAAVRLSRASPADERQHEARWLLHRDGLNLALAARVRLPEDAAPDSVWHSGSDEGVADALRPCNVDAVREAAARFSPAALQTVAQAHEQVVRALTPRRSLPERLEKYVEPAAIAILTLLTLTALWAHRFPAGVDFADHANLISNLGRLISGRASIELEHLYRYEWFTPYALSYAAGGALSAVFGPLVGLKILLTTFALGTWFGLTRWLKTIGSDPAWGVMGLPIFFGYVHLWGLLSNCFALSVVFFYLATVEQTIAAPTRRDALLCLLWGTLLFFTHGITFGLAMLVTVARLLMNPRIRVWLLAGAHLVPLAVLTLVWIRSQPATGQGPRLWVNEDRLITLFSGLFETTASMYWARIGAALLVAALVIVRPRFNRGGGGYVAFGLALVSFVALPEWLAGTWLVGNRMVVFVHAFFLGLFAPWPNSPGRQVLSKLVGRAIALGLMVLLNVRMASFNDEVAGMTTLAAKIPKGSDVMGLVRWTDNVSPTFGALSLLHMTAWVNALNGGTQNEDLSIAFQVPLRRRSDAFPQWFEYGLAHGPLDLARAAANEHMPPAVYVASNGNWHLFHRPPKSFHGLLLVRAMQDSGDLQIDKSVAASPLHVGGQGYPSGLGTHANSWIRVRATKSGHLTGGCGVDDEDGAVEKLKSAVQCVILNDAREVKFDSGPLHGAGEPRRFDVDMREGEELVLEATALSPDITYAHVDWVELQLQ
jgi:hypothetical protein